MLIFFLITIIGDALIAPFPFFYAYISPFFHAYFFSGPSGGSLAAEDGASLFVSSSSGQSAFSGLRLKGHGTHVIKFEAFLHMGAYATVFSDSVTTGANEPSGCPGQVGLWLEFSDPNVRIVERYMA